jgi:hypothetical protein
MEGRHLMTNDTPKRVLPLTPHPDHLRKEAKARLIELKTRIPSARLADVQFTLAREYGFASWPLLMAEVERRCGQRRRTVLCSAWRRRYQNDPLDADEESEAHADFFRVGVAAQVGFFLAAFAAVGLVFLNQSQMHVVHAIFERLTLLP